MTIVPKRIKVFVARSVDSILKAYPKTQAVYLYGTWGTEYQRQDSDLGVAILLPDDETKAVDHRKWHFLATDIARKAHIEHIDLTNIRCVNTSFQIEILSAERLIYCTDEDARVCFEVGVLSQYQRQNEERARIRRAIIGEG